MGALVATTAASVVLSISAWAGAGPEHRGEPHSVGMRPASMHGAGLPGMPMMGRHLDRLLESAQASEPQRSQIRQITDKAQADLKTLHEQGQSLRDQGLKLWAQPKLDAAAAEKLRQQMAAHHEQVSKRMLKAMLDVGNVLTPEQRAKVAQHMQKHHEHMMQRMKDRHGNRLPDSSASQPALQGERQPEGR